MLRQVYQPAGAVFIAAHNVLSQGQVQERLREYILIVKRLHSFSAFLKTKPDDKS